MGSNTNWPRVSGWSCTLLWFTWPAQEVNNDVNSMRRSPSYRLWLWKYVASEPRSGDSPVRIMGAYPKALCSCKPAASKVHQVHLQIRPGAMETFTPSSMRCCPSGRYEDCFKPMALPVPDSTLQLYQRPKSEQEWQVVSFNPNATATAIEQPPAGIAQEWCVRSPNRRTN